MAASDRYSESPPFDAIVVLGARVGPDGRPSAALERRTRRGVALLGEGLAPRLVLSGGVIEGRPAEAEVMRDLALSAGVPDARILLEADSRNTWENARYSARLMAGHGLERALLVTDRLHLPRALLAFRCAGLRVEGRGAETHWREVAPRLLAAQAVYETAAMARSLVLLLVKPRS